MLHLFDKLLIGTVFSDNPRNPEWCDLQTKFLAKTTQNYNLVACLNRVPSTDIKGYDIIKSFNNSKPSNFLEMSKDHCRGLNVLLEEFKTNTCYKYLLILDSDCFPVRTWQERLLARMNEKHKKAAAAIRFENLTAFPHPSVFFITREALDEPWFNITIGKSTNLLFDEIHDTCAGLPIDKFYPLIRTNEWNPHPVFFGIYGHMFYHHACGSREPHFRAAEYYQKNYDVARYWDEFFNCPEHFIRRLKGKEEILL